MRLIAPLVLCALLLAGCGSGGGGGSTTSATSAGAAAQHLGVHVVHPEASGSGSEPRQRPAKPQTQHSTKGQGAAAEFHPKPHHDSGGRVAQFEEKGGDNSIQESGSEASGAELAEAAAALHGYLDARAAGAWSAACSYLSDAAARSLAQLSGAGGGGAKPTCAQVLAGLSAGLPASVLREAAVADVGSLRVKGGSAFILFRGAHGSAYFMPMAREGSEWKVAALAPSALG